MAKKFILGKAPYIRAVDEGKISTTRMMVDFLLALLPIILFAWYKNGLKPYLELTDVSFLIMIWPLLFVVVGGLTSMLLEGFYFACFKGIRGFKNILKEVNLSYAIIPGVLLALILPLYTPIWILMLGCLFANIIFKLLFGGFGHNVFNPALIAYVIIMFVFAGTINNSYFSPSEIYNATSSVTPLTNYAGNLGASYDVLVGSYGNLWNFFVGTIPGSLGETSSILIILAFVYLVARKVINWYVPTIYVGTVFIISWIIGAVNGQAGLWYPTFNILSGGLLFGAVFMATEPVTTPKSPNGKIIFAFFLGVLTCLFRHIGSMPEGVATSILVMCLFTPIIDRFAAIIRSDKINSKMFIKYGCIALLLIALSGYTVYKAVPTEASSNSEIDLDELGYGESTPSSFEFKSVAQSKENYTQYNFVFTKDKNEVTVVMSYDGTKMTFVSATGTVLDEEKASLETTAKSKLPSNRITNVVVEGDKLVLTIQASGFGGSIVAEVTTENGAVTGFIVKSQNESYEEDGGYSPASGDPLTDLPNSLIAAGSGYETVGAISGATITSNAIKAIFKMAMEYTGGNA